MQYSRYKLVNNMYVHNTEDEEGNIMAEDDNIRKRW